MKYIFIALAIILLIVIFGIFNTQIRLFFALGNISQSKVSFSIKLRLRYWWKNGRNVVLFVFIFVLFGLCGVFVYKHPKTVIKCKNYITNTTPFSDEGYVFPLSNKNYLSNEDIEALEAISDNYFNYSYKDCLDFAINEIYARHGQVFNAENKYYDFYNQYDWYQAIPKCDDVIWSTFNDFEKKNINLLVQYEESLGFR